MEFFAYAYQNLHCGITHISAQDMLVPCPESQALWLFKQNELYIINSYMYT